MDIKKTQKTEIEKSVTELNLEIDPRERFLDDYNNCPLCGDELVFSHVTHFIHLEVKEESHCEKCQIRTRTNTHRLQ